MANQTLPSGEVVDTNSEEWRAWCEAKYVVNLKTKLSRQHYIDAIKKIRGNDAALELQENIRVAWNLQKS